MLRRCSTYRNGVGPGRLPQLYRLLQLGRGLTSGKQSLDNCPRQNHSQALCEADFYGRSCNRGALSFGP
jgi:hypothetical protein